MIDTAFPNQIPNKNPAAKLNGVPGKQKTMATAYIMVSVSVPYFRGILSIQFMISSRYLRTSKDGGSYIDVNK